MIISWQRTSQSSELASTITLKQEETYYLGDTEGLYV